MYNYELKEEDWKIYKNEITKWQERFFDKNILLIKEIINSNKESINKFYDVNKFIHKNKKHPLANLDLRRSTMVDTILYLTSINEISFDDLKPFSNELKDYIDFVIKQRY